MKIINSKKKNSLPIFPSLCTYCNFPNDIIKSMNDLHTYLGIKKQTKTKINTSVCTYAMHAYMLRAEFTLSYTFFFLF